MKSLLILLSLILIVTPCLAKEEKQSEVDKARTVVEKAKQDNTEKGTKEINDVLLKRKLKIIFGFTFINDGKPPVPQMQVAPQD